MVFGSTVNAVISNNDFENVNIQILGQEYDGILNLDQKDLSESDNGK
jgi:hypothetical protein